jgi:hypothetical protein
MQRDHRSRPFVEGGRRGHRAAAAAHPLTSF